MVKRVFVAVLLIGIAGIAGVWHRVATGREGGEVRDEISKSYQLSPGAAITVGGINGTVQIDTADTDTAEVLITRTAHSQADLDANKISLDQTSSGLTVRGEHHGARSLWQCIWGGDVKQTVTIKAPRKIALSVNGINGKVQIAQVDGAVKVGGVNGKVTITQAGSGSSVSGVNGAVSISLTALDDKGLNISGINGGIELRVTQGLNASFSATGMNGGVRSEIPGVQVQTVNRNNFSARLGSGGPSISLSGINGGVRLVSSKENLEG
jgi:hypothetical protein